MSKPNRPKLRPPYLTTARSDRICAETGAAIRKGDRIAYFPATGKAYALHSSTAQSIVQAAAKPAPANPADGNQREEK